MSEIGRRGFLQGLGGLVASASLDPERLLWVPGRRTLFLPPQRTLVQVRTLQEALSKGVTAVFPDGSRMVVSMTAGEHSHRDSAFRVRAGWCGMTLAERLAAECRGVEAMGGRVVKIGDFSLHDERWGSLQPGWNW